MTGFEVIVTVGDGLLARPKVLADINSLGPCIFRINGAHADQDQARRLIQECRERVPECRVMIDLPGNKIRTGQLAEPIRMVKGETITLRPFQLNYPNLSTHLVGGEMALAHDAQYRLEVTELVGQDIVLLCHSDGVLESNKGLHIKGVSAELPFLFPRDHDLIDLAMAARVDFLSLSFVRDRDDVGGVYSVMGHQGGYEGAVRHDPLSRRGFSSRGRPKLIAKVETALALDHLDGILDSVDAVNVDRGDLAADIGILRIPQAQRTVVNRAKSARVPVYLATQFLASMVANPTPLIPEVEGLYEAVRMGVSGIQLSEETAIGRYPRECVAMAFNVALAYQTR